MDGPEEKQAEQRDSHHSHDDFRHELRACQTHAVGRIGRWCMRDAFAFDDGNIAFFGKRVRMPALVTFIHEVWIETRYCAKRGLTYAP